MANTAQNPQSYTVTAEVTFDITATSISQAYKEFTTWMSKAFNDSFSESNNPVIVPSSYEGMSVVRNFDAE